MKKLALFLICLAFSFISFSQEMGVEITNEVYFDNSAVVVGEAGEDFDSSSASEAEMTLSVRSNVGLYKKKNPNNKWTLNVYMRGNLGGEILLQVKRTGKGYKIGGNGQPNVQGGEVLKTVTSTPSYFFRGKGEIGDIPVRIKLEGVSLAMGASDYSSNIVFTVSDGW